MRENREFRVEGYWKGRRELKIRGKGGTLVGKFEYFCSYYLIFCMHFRVSFSPMLCCSLSPSFAAFLLLTFEIPTENFGFFNIISVLA